MTIPIPIPPARIERLLKPRSVAVVGASPTPGALGNQLMMNLEAAGFPGAVHLINPKRTDIGGRPCLQSIDQLPDGVDVAVLAIPRTAVLETVRALGARGVGGAIIFSAGFAEGGEQGLAEQQAIAQAATDAGMTIMGPNCLGMVNFMSDVELTFVGMPKARAGGVKRVGIVSQSGAMAAVLTVTLINKEIPLSFYISTGNEAQAQAEDFLQYLVEGDDTDVIALFAEQIRQPRRFQALARAARDRGKRIVLLHPGRSAAARESAATHTGALAGDWQVMRTLAERAGVVLAHDLEEMGDVIDLAVRCGDLRPGAAILGESGAFKGLSYDTAEECGLVLPPLTDANSPKLRAAMPDFVAVSNPTDLTAQALIDPGLYGRVFEALLEDERLGAIIICIIQTDEATATRKFPHIIAAIEQLKPDKPVILSGLDEGAVVQPEYIARLRALGVPYFPTSDRAFRAMARLGNAAGGDVAIAANKGVALDLPTPGGVVPEHRAKALLGPLGVPFPAGRLARSADEAAAAAAELGFPVVLKAQSADLSHKSDAGGVILNLADADAVRAGWERLHANVAAYDAGITLDGALVEAMGARGLELIVGARSDPDWGPVVLVGLGGVTAELFGDVRLLPPDLTADGIRAELLKLKSAPLLTGFRGSAPLDLDAVAALVGTVGAAMRANPRILEIDLNPVVVHPRGVSVLDALMLVAPEA